MIILIVVYILPSLAIFLRTVYTEDCVRASIY